MYKVANVYFLANEILGFDENLTVASSSSDTGAGQRFQSHNRTLEVGSFFRVGGGVHDSYTFQCGLVGYFTSPGIDTRSEPGSIPLRNWNLLPIPIQNPELELNWNCHHWNWN